MRKLVHAILFLVALSLGSTARAQLFFTGTEYGVSAGATQYFGDLNDNYGFKFVRPAFGVFLRDQLNPYIALKATLNYTQVGYDDKYNSDPWEKDRNLNFKSSIIELLVAGEFNFFKFSTGDFEHRFTPYLTIGAGAFYYNPYTTFRGKKYYLRPMGTEGQFVGYADRKYGSVAACFPIGAGVKWWIRPGVNFGFEIADRLTLTDYLDDVSATYVGASKFPNNPSNPNPAYYLQDRSIETNPNSTLGQAGKQRGNTSSYDQYMMAQISLSFQFQTYRCPNYLKRGI
jgi:hypothetical protein